MDDASFTSAAAANVERTRLEARKTVAVRKRALKLCRDAARPLSAIVFIPVDKQERNLEVHHLIDHRAGGRNNGLRACNKRLPGDLGHRRRPAREA